MPMKEYTVKRETLFTQEEFRQILKEAHDYCNQVVKPTAHRIGRRGRLVIARPRAQYQACIKQYIDKKIQERLGSIVGS